MARSDRISILPAGGEHNLTVVSITTSKSLTVMPAKPRQAQHQQALFACQKAGK
ncbi:hypothetical protein [Microcoleus sp. FACHB-68]|uniref:hypothetical protein n=1 Tax=Microcoleus sp. FACHB-68 TaxID=2692826 RepID=UPI001681F5E4|nr:hypothetical protein [Microcoleus sp. FACHB-68]MBD1939150.1 hypothetical protein [Microcoleus sp. FACHB-68]